MTNKGDHIADADLVDVLRNAAVEGNLSCRRIFEIAEEKQVAPGTISKTLNRLNLRIVECQLGLFGYKPAKKLLRPDMEVPAELERALRGRAPENRIPCAALWEIADQFALSRLDAGSACEVLGLKIVGCQLGAFR